MCNRTFFLSLKGIIVSVIAAPSGTAETASALRRLYFVRFAFAIVWALVMFTMAEEITPAGAVLLVLYPLFDVGAAVYDAKVSRSTGSPAPLYVNVAVSLVTAIGLGVACASGIPAVLRVWGAWAVVAGLVQLIVAVPRRKLGGQWPMILSGGISVLAGGSFIASAGADDPALTSAVGYAVPGGIFFLLSALRLKRAAQRR
ncbi:Membrane protein OS=Streptomyces fumanus OX=67302 GN=GCM10018772_71200 PE=4 SV=1 [Streptomyces fumanus]